MIRTYPRPLTPAEEDWLDFLLPDTGSGYQAFRQTLSGRLVVGQGRWGPGDLILGRQGSAAEIDLQEGMQPVMAAGQINATAASGSPFSIVLSLHLPNPDDLVEFQISALEMDHLPDSFTQISRWCYSGWRPGLPCPATGKPVRQLALNTIPDLYLVLSPAKMSMWMHDANSGVNTLIPVGGFYNELMLLKGIRDQKTVFGHKLLFTEPEMFTAEDLKNAFVRYNKMYRKTDPLRLPEPVVPKTQPRGFREKLKTIFGRKEYRQ